MSMHHKVCVMLLNDVFIRNPGDLCPSVLMSVVSEISNHEIDLQKALRIRSSKPHIRKIYPMHRITLATEKVCWKIPLIKSGEKFDKLARQTRIKGVQNAQVTQAGTDPAEAATGGKLQAVKGKFVNPRKAEHPSIRCR